MVTALSVSLLLSVIGWDVTRSRSYQRRGQLPLSLRPIPSCPGRR